VRKVAKPHSVSWSKLLKAILADDRKKVARLLADDPILARRTENKGQFIAPLALAPAGLRVFDAGKSGVTHWFYRGDTALHFCAAAHRAELARLLLRRGADANARNFREQTPLHYACDARPNKVGRTSSLSISDKQKKKGTTKMVVLPSPSQTISVLAKHGADLDARDKGGITPLHRAVRARSTSAVRALLKLGATVDAQSEKGSTPLHLATQSTGAGGTADSLAEQIEIIKLLLSHGASPTTKDKRGTTPIDWAKRREISEILR
jgi:ankyrin repeat protein